MLQPCLCGRAPRLGILSHAVSLSSARVRHASRLAATPAPAPVHLHVDTIHPAPAEGSLPPIVFLHGVLGSGTNFRSIASDVHVRQRRAVITLDLRNHGRSAHVDGVMTLPMLADDVAHTLAAHDVMHPILVGHSLGGKVACLLALRHPAVVSRLVIMDIAPMAYDAHRPDWDAVRNVVDAAAELDVSRFSRRPDVDAALARRVPDAGMRSFVAQNLVLAAGGGSYRWRINLPSIAQSMPHFAAFPQLYDAHDAAAHAHYPPNHCPVDFIAGERSTFCPASAMVQARAYFPEARHHVLQGAGHWLHADKPAEFLHLLRSILGASK